MFKYYKGEYIIIMSTDPMEKKMYEEVRCLRCVLERVLRVMDEGLFVDYQMEKFGRNYKQNE